MSLYLLDDTDGGTARYASPPCFRQCDEGWVTEVTTVLHERNGIRFANSADHWSNFYPWPSIAMLRTEGHESHVDR